MSGNVNSIKHRAASEVIFQTPQSEIAAVAGGTRHGRRSLNSIMATREAIRRDCVGVSNEQLVSDSLSELAAAMGRSLARIHQERGRS